MVCAGAGLTPAPAQADGFGWYVWFFDYEDLQREFRGELGKKWRPTATNDILTEFKPAVTGSAFSLLEVMEESGRVRMTRPRNYDEELLWAEALDEFGRELERRNPDSPGRFLSTGRQFLGIGNMPACRDTHWIHGACGAAVIFTPEEVARLAAELGELAGAGARWSNPEMRRDLLRLRDYIREAAQLKRAVFLYGHD